MPATILLRLSTLFSTLVTSKSILSTRSMPSPSPILTLVSPISTPSWIPPNQLSPWSRIRILTTSFLSYKESNQSFILSIMLNRTVLLSPSLPLLFWEKVYFKWISWSASLMPRLTTMVLMNWSLLSRIRTALFPLKMSSNYPLTSTTTSLAPFKIASITVISLLSRMLSNSRLASRISVKSPLMSFRPTLILNLSNSKLYTKHLRMSTQMLEQSMIPVPSRRPVSSASDWFCHII